VTPQIHKRSAQQEDTRFRVLRLLQDNPKASQREIAAAVGISLGSAHCVLNSLIETGLVTLADFQVAPDKRRYVYILTARGVVEKAAITRRFLARKVAECDALRAEIEALRREALRPEAVPGGVAEPT
jgi:EPS-associated MarR family transcriptional regulator